jgi:pimeloyl-ACP methyl ester carboxylesterase
MFMLNRRLLLGLLSAAAMAPTTAPSQQRGNVVLKRVRTGILEIAYEESGPEAGFPIMLMHGFPYDPRCYDEVVPPLVAAGYRAIVPYLRGFGATRFLASETPRSGQQAAIGRDLLDVMDALNLPRAALVGFDWGGRAAGVVAALWPERVRCAVLANGYHLPGHCRFAPAGGPSAGASFLVPILLQHRARARRPRHEPIRILQAGLAIVVAQLEFR